jgi:hypothetical protein
MTLPVSFKRLNHATQQDGKTASLYSENRWLEFRPDEWLLYWLFHDRLFPVRSKD